MDFVDECNPTDDELRRWANTPGAMYPMEDWAIILASEPSQWNLLFELAAGPCANRDTFVQILYVIVGDAVRRNWRHSPRAEVEALIRRGHLSDRDDVKLWAERADALAREPTLFEYEAWCGGRLALEPRQ